MAGVPAILIGRTPRHAWALMVGHARTADFYLENPLDVTLHRMETIKVKGGEDVALPVFRTSHGPVINPMPYNPETYVPSPANPIITWKYSQRGYELDSVRAFIDAARSKNVDEFGIAVDRMGLSLHILYADQDSNIAYWMSGRNPVRPPGEYRFPQGFLPNAPVLEWDATVVEPRVHDRNPSQGFYGGWNNKSSIDAESSINNFSYLFGPFHRAQVIVDYLEMNQQFTFEELRDLALNIATVDSFDGQAGGDANDVFRGVNGGGNPWKWVSTTFQSAVQANPSPSRLAAMELMTDWDGHFIAGGPSQWVSGVDRADAWILLEAWLREVLRLTFADELGDTTYLRQQPKMLFNVLLHGMKGASSGIVNQYDWFQNASDPQAPQTASAIMIHALDNALAALGARPWGTGTRGEIIFRHDVIGTVHTTPYAFRSGYAQIVEMGRTGPTRIESLLALGQSGNILMNPDGSPAFDRWFFGMTDIYDIFVHRPFPLFD